MSVCKCLSGGLVANPSLRIRLEDSCTQEEPVWSYSCSFVGARDGFVRRHAIPVAVGHKPAAPSFKVAYLAR